MAEVKEKFHVVPLALSLLNTKSLKIMSRVFTVLTIATDKYKHVMKNYLIINRHLTHSLYSLTKFKLWAHKVPEKLFVLLSSNLVSRKKA